MASGGARVRSGPAPDPSALNRDRRVGEVGQWTTLPAEGRKGRTPTWPLPDASEREQALWRMLWKKPQAILWEHNGQHHEVALLVRRMAAAEDLDAPVALGTLVRQLMDSLLLTIPGMRAARVRIAGPGERADAAATPATPAPAPSSAGRGRKSVKHRLTVVRDDGAEGA